MEKFSSTNLTFNLNAFLKNISIKKQYLKNLKKQFLFINNVKNKNYKSLNNKLIKKKQLNYYLNNNLIVYIIDITFSKSNTFLHVMDSSGNLKFFSSAGHFNIKGKNKKFRFNVFKHLYFVLINKLKFLKNKPLALHLKNVSSNKFWIIKKLKTKFFIKVIKIFNLFPFNGCRKKKVRRKKF
jgi:ribosomal protein S11